MDKAGSYLTSTQSDDGSWPYFHSRTPDFSEAEHHARLFGTMMTLMNLTDSDLEASAMFERGTGYVASRMNDDHTWSFYPPDAFSPDAQYEPDTDDTAVALTLLSGRITITSEELTALRSLFDRHRAPDGLYRTYFEGAFGRKGFVPDPNDPSLGVNLNVLAFFGKYGLERESLAEALEKALSSERYWEATPFYRSLPILAYLASNAVEQGAPEAEAFLRRFLGDFDATEGEGFAETLGTVDLAGYIKARSHLCLLDRSPCRDLDMVVFELAKRRNLDGSWPVAPFYAYDVNPEALLAFVERRDYTRPGEGGRVDYDVERALRSPGTTRQYDGSAAETTSFALKALVLYARLLEERPAF